MEHARHVFRVLLALAVLVVAGILGRAFAIPDTFGVYGHYRASNVQEQASHTPVHGGAQSCASCHQERFAEFMSSGHKSINCEVCHGPVARHVTAGKRSAAANVERSWTMCARCHARISGRPANFPQVDPHKHVADVDEKLEGAVCMNCHNPHAPKP